MKLLHRPPFLFVGDVRAEAPPALEVWAQFPDANPYLVGAVVPRLILVEALAQAVAVHAAREKGEARPGVLAMLRHVSFSRDVSRAERVFLRVQPQRWYGKLRMFSAAAFAEGDASAAVCTGDIIVAEVSA